MPEIIIDVEDHPPPTKNEAKSLLSAGHGQEPHVRALLTAARTRLEGSTEVSLPHQSLGIEVTFESPTEPSADATNYLGGIGDVLQEKAHRPNLSLEHLGELADVAVFGDDKQLHEVRYRWERGDRIRYRVRVWTRGSKADLG